jgi:hypothetical protein
VLYPRFPQAAGIRIFVGVVSMQRLTRTPRVDGRHRPITEQGMGDLDPNPDGVPYPLGLCCALCGMCNSIPT